MNRRVASILACSLITGMLAAGAFVGPALSGGFGDPSPMSPPSTWSDAFDDRTGQYDMRGFYTAYDDADSASGTDGGDRVMISQWTSASPTRSLRIRAVSSDGPSPPAIAYATTSYFRDWETAKGYRISFSFYLNTTDNLRLVVLKTVDVYLVVAGANPALSNNGRNLWSYSSITLASQLVVSNLAVGAWHTMSVCVSCTDGSFLKSGDTYSLTFDGTPLGDFTRFSNVLEPRALAMGDLGNGDVSVNVINTKGEGFWDDLALEYWPVVPGPEAYAGADQSGLEGQNFSFSGQGRGGLAPSYHARTDGGFDLPLTTNSSGTWVTRDTEQISGTSYYVGLLTATHGLGRAVYAPGDGLSPRNDNGDAPYQVFVNAVRWSANSDLPPPQINVLLIWGHRELVTYHGASWNQYRALLSEGFNVTLSRELPADLSPYRVIVMGSSGWTQTGQSQQGHPLNENYCSVSGCGTPLGDDLSGAEGTQISTFIAGGGGFVASAERESGHHLNLVSGAMNVWFSSTGNPDAWDADVMAGQEHHAILERWGGIRLGVVSYCWSFGDTGTACGPTVTHAYGRAGAYIVTLTVTDESGQQGTDTLQVTVSNVSPTVEVWTNLTGCVNEGSPLTADGQFEDPSWNDSHTAVWDFWKDDHDKTRADIRTGTFSPGPGFGNTIHYMDGAQKTYGDNGVFTLYLNVTDEFGGFGSASTTVCVLNAPPVVLNVTVILHGNAQRTHGYWKHQCTIGTPQPDHPGIPQAWIDFISTNSAVFWDVRTKLQACALLDPPTPLDPMEKAKMQLYALWLNVASGLLFWDTPLDHPSVPTVATVREFIVWAETIILTSPTPANLNLVSTVADDINKDADGGTDDFEFTDPIVAEYIAYLLDPGSDDLTVIWDDGLGGIVTHLIQNEVGVSDPMQSPWGVWPFSTSDRLIVGYPKDREGVPTPAALVCVKDDDGGIAVEASGCPGPPPPGPGPTAVNWTISFGVEYRQITGLFTVADVDALFLATDPLVVPVEDDLELP